MLPRLRQQIGSWKSWLPEGLAILGAVAYFLQSRFYALTQLSVLDEGAYLLKGYWFATGQYFPYQDYGPLTNHMPLAFIIPGYIQAWFGPSLEVGRFFAVFLGMLFIFGLWLISRRMSGPWWAAAAVWAIVLNPALIKMYSVGVTQGLIAAMLIWVLYLTLGKERSRWQIGLGAGLSGVMALTRLNMTPVLLLLVLYLIWEHGWRTGALAGAAGIGIWLLGHALFWPGILQMWAAYTPQTLTPFLDAWRIPPEALPSWTSGASLQGRLLSFLEALRFNFIPLASALASWLLWPKSHNWQDASERRAAIFLSALLAMLLLIHAIASLGADYCVFCFPLYTAFFSVLGLLLFMLVWPRRPSVQSQARKIIAGTLLLAIPAALSVGSYSLFATAIPPRVWVRSLMIFGLPRVADFSLQPGSIPLWGLLENRFGLGYSQSFRMVQNGLGFALMLIIGLLFGFTLFWMARRLPEFVANRSNFHVGSFGSSAMLLLLMAGFVLSPSPFLGGGYRTYDCDQNVIAGYERLAAELQEQLRSNALVFWRGSRSAVPLLQIEAVQTFPAQLNGDYSYRLGGSADDLERYGLWGPILLQDWLQQADFILVEKDLYRTWLQDALESGPYELLATTNTLVECSPRSQILIYAYRPD